MPASALVLSGQRGTLPPGRSRVLSILWLATWVALRVQVHNGYLYTSGRTLRLGTQAATKRHSESTDSARVGTSTRRAEVLGPTLGTLRYSRLRGVPAADLVPTLSEALGMGGCRVLDPRKVHCLTSPSLPTMPELKRVIENFSRCPGAKAGAGVGRDAAAALLSLPGCAFAARAVQYFDRLRNPR